jgi:hypothetical protein
MIEYLVPVERIHGVLNAISYQSAEVIDEHGREPNVKSLPVGNPPDVALMLTLKEPVGTPL